jgi:hypothetical protein
LIERRYVLFTDDEQEAFTELLHRRGQAAGPPSDDARYRGWDMGEVRFMVDPPTTEKKFCVFQIQENK